MTEYIEREAALEAAKKSHLYFDIKPIINSIPAADVRPVVRGRWIEQYEQYSIGEETLEAQYGYKCSICGRWEYEKEPFCNCGAWMEES